jgi:hypothetical protein
MLQHVLCDIDETLPICSFGIEQQSITPSSTSCFSVLLKVPSNQVEQ